jgi:hypothetical protein
MEATTIVLVVGLATLIVERFFSYGMKIKKSECISPLITIKTEQQDTPLEIKK